jgi:hypothetical protein
MTCAGSESGRFGGRVPPSPLLVAPIAGKEPDSIFYFPFTLLNKIQTLQNRILRMVINAP